MAFTPNFIDLVRNYTTTSGTNDFVLSSAVNGFTSFTTACKVGDTFYYSALGVDNPADTEVGRGTLLSGGVISRDPISGTKTNFKTGTKSISLITAAEWFAQANALVGSMTPVGQSLVNAPSAADARTALALDHIAVNPAWYGLIEGDDPAHGAANTAAFAQMLADVETSKRFRIMMPAGVYWFADNGSGAAIDIAAGNLHIDGSAAGGSDEIGELPASILKFPTGVTGIRIQDYQTSGASTKDSVSHASGGVVLRNLTLEGAFATSGVEKEAHGVQLRRTSTLENLTIANFEGDGIHASADGAAGDAANPPYGNVDISFISRCNIKNCRNGLFFDGGDSNACTIVHLNSNINRQWGVWDSSMLGNTYVGGQFTANGIVAANDGVNIGVTQVSYNGHYYGVIVGQEAWCSANAPSGTTANNQGWYYKNDGGPISGIPAWSDGILCRAGGCIHDDSDVGRGTYIGIYVEYDQGKAQLTEPSVVLSGGLGGWIFQNAASSVGEVAVLRSGGYSFLNIAGTAEFPGALQVNSGKVLTAFGYPQGNSFNVALNVMHQDWCPAGYQLMFAGFSGSDGDIRFEYAEGAAHVFAVTTPTTLMQFGTGAAVPHAFCPMRLMVCGNNPDNFVDAVMSGARHFMIDSAPPATGAHGQGEWCLDKGSTPGLIGWKCTAAGTPGTWEAVYGGYGTGPVGYAAGAGGTVTQTTSKSDAVTLNKLCGQIVMNAAELAADTGIAFTVNDSEVAATDVIELVLASGGATPGTYNYQVDAVSAGGFVIWVKNISANPLSEALVFNFAVKKAVVA